MAVHPEVAPHITRATRRTRAPKDGPHTCCPLDPPFVVLASRLRKISDRLLGRKKPTPPPPLADIDMSRPGPPHYHQGSNNLCYCAFLETHHNPPAPYIYPSAPARPRPIAGHPSEYGPAIRRTPKPKPINKIAKSRDMKFDENSWQWYFETAEAPGVKWLDSVRHIEDLPQAKDPDFLAMLNEYYIAGHVIDMPDQDRLPVLPGGPGKSWRYKRAAPPPPVKKQATQHPPAQQQPQTWIELSYHQSYPVAPQYASGSAHPVSMRLPSGASPHDAWRAYSTLAPPPAGSERLGPLPGAPGPRHYVDATAHRRYRPAQEEHSDEESEEEEEEDDDDESNYSYDRPEELHRSRAYIPPPSPKSQRRARKLRERGFRVVDPHTNANTDGLEALRLEGQPVGKHGRSASAPNVLPTTYEKVDIHSLLQTRTTLGVARMPDLVFDLRYDPRHAFDRSENQKDLTTAPAFQPPQKFVRLLIRHPFGGRGGDWVEDVEDAQYLTVMGVLRIISDMVHRYIDQGLDWDPLSELDKSFVYEAYINRPCPDEDAAGRRLHLFCEKYMFGGIEQLPPKAKGTTAEGPTFSVKLIRNSKFKRYDKLIRSKWSRLSLGCELEIVNLRGRENLYMHASTGFRFTKYTHFIWNMSPGYSSLSHFTIVVTHVDDLYYALEPLPVPFPASAEEQFNTLSRTPLCTVRMATSGYWISDEYDSEGSKIAISDTAPVLFGPASDNDWALSPHGDPDVGINSIIQYSRINTQHPNLLDADEILSHLKANGCEDASTQIDWSSLDSVPVENKSISQVFKPSDIYRGNLKNRQQPVAVVCFQMGASSNEDELTELKNAAHEISRWSKCKHPNILGLVGLTVHHDRMALVTPWTDFLDLQEFLLVHPQANRYVLSTQIAYGVAYLHGKNIGYVGVMRDHTPKITGFCEVTLFNSGFTNDLYFDPTQRHNSTARWMPPEILMDESNKSTEGDVYSLAMTILEVITGAAPYEGHWNGAAVLKIANGHHPRRPVMHLPSGDEKADMLWILLVYRGQLKDGSRIALKCLRLTLDSSDFSQKQVRNAAHELYIWSKCNHPNVLELIGVTQYRNQIAMASPWMEHGTLGSFISRHPQIDRYALSAQIADGVAYLHSKNIVHGDIKGTNILISKDYTPKITDFGTATLREYTLRFTASDTTSKPGMSLRWTAPEILEETTGTSFEGDIYALGMTILEAITGEVPYFETVNESALVLKIARQEHPVRPEAKIPLDDEKPNLLWSLLTKCWSYDPQNRPLITEVQNTMRVIASGN
ncbi:hypothetical protein OPQ81_007287 [Rhizoctonia solani]|nr:hypothetical protein OPQ81_007287 [Rhizoctonia solani]